MPEVVVAGDFDANDQDTIVGLHGTIAEQQDETHYDKRDNADDDVDKGKIRFPAGKLYGRDQELNELRSIYGRVEYDGRDVLDADKDPTGATPQRPAGQSASVRSTQIVFLGGLPGTGKSTLVNEVLRTAVKENAKTEKPERRPLFGSGKYAQFGEQAGIPFSALSEALGGLTRQLLDRAKEDRDEGGAEELRLVRSNLKKVGLGPKDEGGRVLMGMFPSVAPLLVYQTDVVQNGTSNKENEGEKNATTKIDTNGTGPKGGDDQGERDRFRSPLARSVSAGARRTSTVGAGMRRTSAVGAGMRRTSAAAGMRRISEAVASFDALKIVVHNFVAALCRKQVRPIMMFIDDLQWADEASLDVLSSLLKSDGLKQFLFIGAYRSNEVKSHDHHPLAKCMLDIESSVGDAAVRRMEIGGLAPSDVTQFIVDSLEKDPAEVSVITDLVYSKTLGNIFFIRCALEELVRKNVLYFDIISYEWKYNLKLETEINSFVNNDVESMIRSKIKELDVKDQRALILSSYTSNIIDVGTLHSLLNADGYSFDIDQVSVIFERAVTEGLLLRSSSPHTFTFSHDIIQAALYESVEAGEERNRLLVFIGNALVSRYALTGQEWLLFVAVNHLNSVPQECIDFPLDKLAELNLDVAKLASSKADVSQAADYLRAGVKCLEADNGWKNQYDLRLELFNDLIQAEATLGNYSAAEAAIEEVLQNAACLDDKSVAHLHLIHISAQKNDLDFGIGAETGVKVLNEYGRELPLHPSWLHVASERMRAALKCRGKPLMNLINMPIMEDDAIMRLYNDTQRLANMSNNFPLASTILYRATQIACTEGISPQFAQIAANSSVRLVAESKFKKANRYGNLARAIVERFPQDQSEADCAELKAKLKMTVDPTQYPYREGIAEFHEMYKTMISHGLVEMGIGSAMVYGLSYFAAGLPLNSILDKKLAVYERSANELGQKSFVSVFQASRQFILNLLGRSEGVVLLNGDAFNEDRALGQIEGNSKAMLLRDASTFRVQLAYIFNDTATMKEMIERLKTYPLFDLMTARQHLRITFLGLAAFELGNRETNKEYLKLGKSITRVMKKLDKGGSANAHPVYLSLEAAKKPGKERYNLAIEACANARMIHLEAMMNERCSAWLQEQNDEGNARAHMLRAFSCYHSWGARAKVAQLRQLYPYLERTQLQWQHSPRTGRSDDMTVTSSWWDISTAHSPPCP